MEKPLIGIGADVKQSGSGGREQAFGYMNYIDAVLRGGAIPVIIPPQPQNVDDLLASLDGVLLAGGRDCDPALYGEQPHPTVEPMDTRRQGNDLALAKAARERGIPTLGVCLGLQVMSVAAGGTLIQDISEETGTSVVHESEPGDRARHEIRVEKGTALDAILKETALVVNSSHHQAVRSPGEGLRVSAWALDGIVEGIEDPAHPFYIGVQWHPEDMPGEASAEKIFDAFIQSAMKHARSRNGGGERSGSEAGVESSRSSREE
jgi:putative glutamine amidotransferase